MLFAADDAFDAFMPILADIAFHADRHFLPLLITSTIDILFFDYFDLVFIIITLLLAC